MYISPWDAGHISYCRNIHKHTLASTLAKDVSKLGSRTYIKISTCNSGNFLLMIIQSRSWMLKLATGIWVAANVFFRSTYVWDSETFGTASLKGWLTSLERVQSTEQSIFPTMQWVGQRAADGHEINSINQLQSGWNHVGDGRSHKNHWMSSQFLPEFPAS